MAINLLPGDSSSHARDRQIFMGIILGLGALVIILAVVTAWQRQSIRAEEKALAKVSRNASRLRLDVGRLQHFGELQTKVEGQRTQLASALAGDIAWSKLLNDVSVIMPDNSWLVSLALASNTTGQAGVVGTVNFTGYVFDFPGLSGWLTRTSEIEGLNLLYLTSGTKAKISSREVVSFASNANITQALLSQRCQPQKPCP